MNVFKIFTYYYSIDIIIVIILIALSYLYYDKRYKKAEQRVPEGYIRTNEVNIDPITNERQRTYYHPDTGHRIYIKEKE